MTREKEIKTQAQLYSPNDIGIQAAFEESARWADRTMIDKACDWLDDYLTFSVAEWDEGVTTQRVIDKFRKAMKGE